MSFRTCSSCHGVGMTITRTGSSKDCNNCQGSGKIYTGEKK